jgi:hypothetical protein
MKTLIKQRLLILAASIIAIALPATVQAVVITNAPTAIEINLDAGSPTSPAWYFGTDYFANYGQVTADTWNAGTSPIGSRAGAILQWNLSGLETSSYGIDTVANASFTLVSGGNSAGNTYKVYRLQAPITGATTWNTKPQLDTSAFVSFTMGSYPDYKTIDVSSLLTKNGTLPTFGVAILVDSINTDGGSTGDSHFWSTAYGNQFPAFNAQNKLSADYTTAKIGTVSNASTSLEKNLAAGAEGGGDPTSSAWFYGTNWFESYGQLTVDDWNSGNSTFNYKAGAIFQWNLNGLTNPGDTVGNVKSASFTIMGKDSGGNTYKVYRLQAPITGTTSWNTKPQLDTSTFVTFTMDPNYSLQTIDVSSLLSNNGSLTTFGIAVLVDTYNGGENFWSTAYGNQFPAYANQNKLGASYTINSTAPAGYSSWATTNADSQAANLDYDNDGVSNGIEYFMNAAPGFTTNPGPVGSTVTWVNGGNVPSSAYGTAFVVQSSTDLVTWTDVPGNDPNLVNSPGSVSYALPNSSKQFARIKVTLN